MCSITRGQSGGTGSPAPRSTSTAASIASRACARAFSRVSTCNTDLGEGRHAHDAATFSHGLQYDREGPHVIGPRTFVYFLNRNTCRLPPEPYTLSGS
jgi:hypothetical protein